MQRPPSGWSASRGTHATSATDGPCLATAGAAVPGVPAWLLPPPTIPPTAS
jgi:hypothetical protein